MNKKINSGSFVKGFTPWNKGKKLSRTHCDNLSISHMGNKQTQASINKRVKKCSGKNHWKWAENPTYVTLHEWVYKKFGKAYKCEMPGCSYPKKIDKGVILKSPSRYEWSNKNGKYDRKRSSWWQLCPSCHRKYDYQNNIKKPSHE